MHEFFFHLIFPCANSFVVLRPPPPPDKFSNGPSLISRIFKNMMMGKQFKIKGDDQLWTSNAAPVGA